MSKIRAKATPNTSYWRQRNRADALEHENIVLRAKVRAYEIAPQNNAAGIKLKAQRLHKLYVDRASIVAEGSVASKLYLQMAKELADILGD